MGRRYRRLRRRVANLPLAARFVRLRAPFVIDSLMAFCVQMGMLTVAYFRGVDYVLLPDGPTPVVLSLIERAAPLDVWGSFFIGAAVLGAIGAHFGRWRICAVGHGMLVAIYLVFGIGSMIDVFGRAELFGFRTGLGWIFGAAVVHAALFRSSMDAWRTANAP